MHIFYLKLRYFSFHHKVNRHCCPMPPTPSRKTGPFVLWSSITFQDRWIPGHRHRPQGAGLHQETTASYLEDQSLLKRDPVPVAGRPCPGP